MSKLREAAQAALTAYGTFRDVDDIDGLDDAMDRLSAAIEQHVAEAVARERVTVLDEVLRGLRSERDTNQLRAIIAEVEAIRAAAEIGRQMEEQS
jgi:hypothetical protein